MSAADSGLRLEVASREMLAANVVGLSLVRPDRLALPRWQPGAHIDVVLANGMMRQYSLCGDPDTLSAYRIGVLRESTGRGGSTYVHDALNVGDTVTIRGPRNHFALLDAPNYLFIAGGIGITPLLPMMAAAEFAGAHWQCHYGGRSRATMAFVQDLARYGAKVCCYPQDESGLLDLDSILGVPKERTLIYCCGPEPLLQAVAAHCERYRWTAGALHVERFAAPKQGSDALDRPFEVVLARSGRVVQVPAGCTVLDAIASAGVAVASSCGAGTCGTCETAVLEGQPDHRDVVLTEDDKREGKFTMICVSRALSDRLVLDL